MAVDWNKLKKSTGAAVNQQVPGYATGQLDADGNPILTTGHALPGSFWDKTLQAVGNGKNANGEQLSDQFAAVTPINPYFNNLAPGEGPNADQEAAWRAGLTPDQQVTYGSLGAARTARDQNAGVLNGLTTDATNTFAQQNAYQQGNQALAGQQQQQASWLGQQNAGLSAASGQSASQANAADQGTLGQFRGAVDNATAWDMQNYGNLQGAYGNTGILQAGGYGPNVVSQAQYAQADPNSINGQYQAMAGLGNFANGSQALTSRAAGAYADGQTDADYRAGLGELHGVAGGSNDVQVGQMDPQARAAQLGALGQLQGLTGTEATAQERFMYEQSRIQAERDERANRAAVMTDQRMRGLGGGASELADAAIGGAQTSRNRMLQDMAANAGAVDRSMRAIEGVGQMSTAMSGQANQLGTANADRRTGALGQYVDQYGQLRNQTFDEAFSRGQATDQTNQFNNTQKLQATGMQGDLASTMRGQSFNEDFQTKSAADSMSMFNKEQSQISQRWQEQYAAGQQTDYWNRNKDLNTAADNVSKNYSTNQLNLANAGFDVNANTDKRTQDSLGFTRNLGNDWVAATQDSNKFTRDTNNDGSTLAGQQLGVRGDLAKANMGLNSDWASTVHQTGREVLGDSATEAATQTAADAAKEDANNKGILGTSILSKNDPLSPVNWFRGKLGS